MIRADRTIQSPQRFLISILALLTSILILSLVASERNVAKASPIVQNWPLRLTEPAQSSVPGVGKLPTSLFDVKKPKAHSSPAAQTKNSRKSAARPNTGNWDPRFGPTEQGLNNIVYAVEVANNGDVYVGGAFTVAGGVSANYIARWDGTSWSPLGSGTNGSVLNIAAANNGDIYAGGQFTVAGGVSANYIARWDGTSWSPLGSGTNGTVNSVKIAGNGVVYAGGEFTLAGDASANHIAGWDGSNWSPLGTGTDNLVWSLEIASNGDVYAGGEFITAGDVDVHYIARWDGASWSSLGSGMNGAVYTVEIPGNGYIYAGGNFISAGGVTNANYIARWDGSSWSPLGTGMNDYVNSIALASTGEIYAGGNFTAAGGNTAPYIAMWDGGMWSSLGAGTNSTVYNIDVGSNNQIYSGGSFTTAGDLPSYYFGIWYPTGIPSPTPEPPTQTPGGATATTAPSHTPVVPTNTEPPAATPTVITCEQQYADIPESNTFYPFVMCLSCQGIISGYPCGGPGEPCDIYNGPYFRPNVNVTRGQIAKIVSNSAGYIEEPGPQIYTDVPTTNTFYQWINRLSGRGHMGGYNCGGVGEPCDSDNRPYFRPAANATRAQLAKIVSNAAGYSDALPDQLFTDVPGDNGFYIWIQRLASRGVMGGYACGGPGEPCDSQNRPYFRPFNNVTRGQTSKIVSGAFFPNCRLSIMTPTPGPTATQAPVTSTPTPCAPDTNYTITSSTGVAIVPGTTDVGNHTDDGLTLVDLPFPFHLYGSTFSLAALSPNGDIQFISRLEQDYYDQCLPYSLFHYVIMPYWDDMNTQGAGKGIFTSVSGTAPNRIFNVEWRTSSTHGSANFEVRLYESGAGSPFDFIYGNVSTNTGGWTVGVQKDATNLNTQYSCGTGALPPGLKLTFTQLGCQGARR